MKKTSRRPSDKVQVSLRVKESLRRKLERSADANGLSMNAEIIKRLERSFEEQSLFTPRHEEMLENFFKAQFAKLKGEEK